MRQFQVRRRNDPSVKIQKVEIKRPRRPPHPALPVELALNRQQQGERCGGVNARETDARRGVPIGRLRRVRPGRSSAHLRPRQNLTAGMGDRRERRLVQGNAEQPAPGDVPPKTEERYARLRAVVPPPR